MNTDFSKKSSYYHPTSPRKGELPWFLGLLFLARVSETGGGSQTWCRVLEGRDLGKLEQGEELSIHKARHHDPKKETGGEKPSNESSCSDSSQLPQWNRGAQICWYHHSHSPNGRRKRKKWVCHLWCVSFRDRFTVTRSSLDGGLCSGQGPHCRSIPVFFTWLCTPWSLKSSCDNLPSLRQLSRPLFSDDILPSSH